MKGDLVTSPPFLVFDNLFRLRPIATGCRMALHLLKN
jgi:hypothetical protein